MLAKSPDAPRFVEQILDVLPVERCLIVASEVQSIWQPALASSRGVFRLTLRLNPGRSTATQTFVVKIVDESSPGRREASLYASGALDQLVPRMSSAACHGVVRLDDGDTAIAAAAQVVTPRNLMARDAVFTAAIATMRTMAHRPDVRKVFPPDVVRRLNWLATDVRRGLLEGDAAPLLVCHGDVQRRNLVAIDAQRVAFIDWANLAMGPPGLDVATLIYYAIAWGDLRVADLGSFCSAMIANYLQGQGEAGWAGDGVAVHQSIYEQLIVGLGVLEAANTMRMIGEAGHGQRVANRICQPLEDLVECRRSLTAGLLRLSEDVLAPRGAQ
jgi:hypothetical protein